VKRTHWTTLTIAAVAVSAILLVLYTWRLPPFGFGRVSTENAYLRGSVTVIAPKVDGYVAEVLVSDFSPVEKGQPLVRLDDRNYRQKLEQAQAALELAKANLDSLTQAMRAREAAIRSADAAVTSARAQGVNAAAQLSRTRADQARADSLIGDGSISIRERDQSEGFLRAAEAGQLQAAAAVEQSRAARAVAQQDLETVKVNRRALEAGIRSAQAAVKLAEIDLENTVVRAPATGRTGEIGVKLGQYVTPGAQLLSLVPSRVWVIANFKEAQTAEMREGQAAELHVDAVPGIALTGKVEQLSPATGSEFSVLRTDNATGNFTKIPQRVPVRIGIEASPEVLARLRPGMSVLVEVRTGG